MLDALLTCVEETQVNALIKGTRENTETRDGRWRLSGCVQSARERLSKQMDMICLPISRTYRPGVGFTDDDIRQQIGAIRQVIAMMN